MLHTLVIVSLLVGYLFGFSVELLCSIAIIRKLDLSQRGDLVLIVSLAGANALGGWSNNIGCIAALSGAQVHRSLAGAIGLVQSIGWLSGALHMNALALNRFVAVFMPLRYAVLCSGQNMARASPFMWLAALGLALSIYAFAQPIVWSSAVLSSVYDFSHNATAAEPVNFILEVFDYSSYVIAVCSYSLVIWKIFHTHFCGQQQDSNIDLRLCVQFVLIYVIFVLQSQAWELLAWGGQYWYVVNYATLANFTMNGYIYLVFNQPIRHAVKELLGIHNNEVQPNQQPNLFVNRAAPPQEQDEANL